VPYGSAAWSGSAWGWPLPPSVGCGG
jgi:hypothetical protein